MPDQPRLASLCYHIREDPGSSRTPGEWARVSGGST
jgi:hypothetical protein